MLFVSTDIPVVKPRNTGAIDADPNCKTAASKLYSNRAAAYIKVGCACVRCVPTPCRGWLGSSGAWVSGWRAHTQLGQLDEAIQDCTRSLELDPEFLKVLLRRADLYMKKERYQEAVQDYEKAHQLDGASRGTARAVCRHADARTGLTRNHGFVFLALLIPVAVFSCC